jgi:hypothetical protein
VGATKQGIGTGNIVLSDEEAAWFWSHALIGSMDSCWPWVGPGTRLASGHWQVWINRRKLLVHRVSFVLAGGDLSDGLLVRHRCMGDPNPRCLNPRHLSAGTALENCRDRDEAGRRTPFLPRGERHWSAKLTQHDAERMREARRLGLSAETVAGLFGVSRATVYRVWGYLAYTTGLPVDVSHG